MTETPGNKVLLKKMHPACVLARSAIAVFSASVNSGNSGPVFKREITMRQKHSASYLLPRRIRRYGFITFAIALVMPVIGLAPAARAASGNQLQITAMTYNLFQGSELTEASSAATPAQFLAAGQYFKIN